MLLGLGMLIDGAIVVVELADRNMTAGLRASQAYLKAAKRMFGPLSLRSDDACSIFTADALAGVTGQFMRYLPVTVFAVLAGSLLYALVFAPVLGSIIRPRAERRQDPLQAAGKGQDYGSMPVFWADMAVFYRSVRGIRSVCLP